MEPKLDFVFTSPVDKPITLGHEGLVMGTLKNKGLIAQVDQALPDHPQQSLSNGEMLALLMTFLSCEHPEHMCNLPIFAANVPLNAWLECSDVNPWMVNTHEVEQLLVQIANYGPQQFMALLEPLLEQRTPRKFNGFALPSLRQLTQKLGWIVVDHEAASYSTAALCSKLERNMVMCLPDDLPAVQAAIKQAQAGKFECQSYVQKPQGAPKALAQVDLYEAGTFTFTKDQSLTLKLRAKPKDIAGRMIVAHVQDAQKDCFQVLWTPSEHISAWSVFEIYQFTQMSFAATNFSCSKEGCSGLNPDEFKRSGTPHPYFINDNGLYFSSSAQVAALYVVMELTRKLMALVLSDYGSDLAAMTWHNLELFFNLDRLAYDPKHKLIIADNSMHNSKHVLAYAPHEVIQLFSADFLNQYHEAIVKGRQLFYHAHLPQSAP